MSATQINLKTNPIGHITSVESSHTLIKLTDSNIATHVAIGNLIAIHGATENEFLIGYIEKVSRTLKKDVPLKVCIPPKQLAEFVYHMQDVPEVYQKPYALRRLVVCMDETFKQLIDHVRDPLPMMPGQVERVDHVYQQQQRDQFVHRL